MLEIHYSSAKTDTHENVKTYPKASDFVAAQYKEVPDLQDYYVVHSATIDGQAIDLADQTILGLFNYLNQAKA